MEDGTLIQIFLDKEFNQEIDRKLLELKETGVKKSKATYIKELAQLAFHQKKTKTTES
jgi:hypothetical protein